MTVQERQLACVIVSIQSHCSFNRGKTTNKKAENKMQKATFGAGCFWGVEAEFRQLPKGIGSTAVGYEGGTMNNPNYRDVCTNRTGHAEVEEEECVPENVTHEDLLISCWV